MKIYDCFSFFDELDLLEIRLNILDQYVDKFVIVEARETFNGHKKPLVFSKNQTRYKKWESKIIHYVVDEFPNNQEIYNKALNSPNTGNKEHWWLREFYQKEHVNMPLSSCDDDDIIYVSDVDEIWNPELSIPFDDKNVFRPIQTAYPFFLNNRSNQNYNDWTGTRAAKYKVFKKYGANHFRTEREVKSTPIFNGGWHFSWLHKKEDKWNDSHPNNNIRFASVKNTKMWKDESELPSYLKENKQTWINLFLAENI